MSANDLEENPSVEEKNDTSNIDRVKFIIPKAKQIVSPHSGSILSQPDPVAPLDPILRDNACVIFRAAVGSQSTVESATLPEILLKCGFDYELDVLTKAVNKIYTGPKDLDETEFLAFLAKFHAPEYYYGQRLRRNAGRGQVAEVVELLVRNCDVNTGDGEGLTSLHYASEFNQSAVINAIVSTSAKSKKLVVDCKDKYGWTPLYCAAHHGHLDCVTLLIELGANPLIKNSVGKNALHAACAQNRGLIVDFLLRSALPKITNTRASVSNIRGSISSTSSSELAALLNAQDDRGMTPLHEAAYRGHGTLYQILSRNANADLDALDAMGHTAAEYLTDFLPGGAASSSVTGTSKPPSAAANPRATNSAGSSLTDDGRRSNSHK